MWWNWSEWPSSLYPFGSFVKQITLLMSSTHTPNSFFSLLCGQTELCAVVESIWNFSNTSCTIGTVISACFIHTFVGSYVRTLVYSHTHRHATPHRMSSSTIPFATLKIYFENWCGGRWLAAVRVVCVAVCTDGEWRQCTCISMGESWVIIIVNVRRMFCRSTKWWNNITHSRYQ